MFVYILNKDNLPLIPIKPGMARKLLDDNLAEVISNSPFIIKRKHKAKQKRKVINLNINFMIDRYEFGVYSQSGDIYFYRGLEYGDDFLNDTNGLFSFLFKYIPISNVYFMINQSAIRMYDVYRNKFYIFKDFSVGYEFLLTNKGCEYCYRELDFHYYRLRKIYKQYNFLGNSIIVCDDCIKRYRSNEETNYMRAIKNIMGFNNIAFEEFKKFKKKGIRYAKRKTA